MSNLPVFDAPELKDRILKLRAQKSALQKDKAAVQQQIQAKERQLLQLRQEATILAPDQDLRFQGDADDLLLGPEGDTPADLLRFRVANDKLEMEILMQDIRSALPGLEREAKALESIAASRTKSAAKSKVSTIAAPSDAPLLWRTAEELHALVDQEVDRTIQAKTRQAELAEEERKTNQQLSQQVAALRRDFNRILRERVSANSSVTQMEQQWRIEQHRMQILREEHMMIRATLQCYHSGYGWQTEVFREAVGGDDGKLPVYRISSVLKPWILVAAANPHAKDWQDDAFIREQVNTILREERSKPAPQSAPLAATSTAAAPTPVAAEAVDVTEDEDRLMMGISDSKPQLSSEDEFKFFDEQDNKADTRQAQSKQEGTPRSRYGNDSAEDEEEELVIIRAAADEKPSKPKPSAALNAGAKGQPAQNKAAEDKDSKPTATSATEDTAVMPYIDSVDLRTFCMLCDRLVIVLEQ